jgi:acyl-coenzyme A synthetase/AMP-(fatty) acid ligase
LTEAAAVIRIGDGGRSDVTRLPGRAGHPLLREMAARGAAGLILFSSGSTGPSKAALLDFERLLAKFHTPRPAVRTFAFLQLDHIGGINTLSHVFCNGGTVVTAAERSVDAVCAAIERHRVQLLPTTPTFLRMMMIAGAPARYDLTSLETVTYGTEPMPETTLAAARRALPQVRFKQTYGLSELGILPTRSESSDSLWLKLGSAGFDARIVDGVLWLKSQSAMLGYLNAPSPFDADGWFNTQDRVEMRGEYIRILGRRSEFINVGGDKVHPAEVENVLLTLDNVVDVTVFGRRNAVTGEIVCARVTLAQPEESQGLRQRLRAHCRGRLQPYKIPAVVEVADGAQHSYRFKKLRDAGAAGA